MLAFWIVLLFLNLYFAVVLFGTWQGAISIAIAGLMFYSVIQELRKGN
jgi:hypothetical protein